MSDCSTTDCNRSHYARGYCHACYEYLRKHELLELTVVTKQNRSKNPLFKVYNNMRARCLNEKAGQYNDYGGRGITICDRWLGVEGFNNFLADMGERPTGYTLDRINNDGNYEPANCRWTTRVEQANNQRDRKDNTTGHRGIYWNKKGSKWEARRSINKIEYCLGFFDKKEDAVNARKQFELGRGLI
jgi:hypothetical protein